MRSAALPKAFGLTEQAKGYFPHFFNRAENWNYRGPYPSVEEYGIHSMSTNDCENFLHWYHSRRDDFDFQQQMLMYCRNDVQLLREACMKFRHLLLSITGESVEEMDPETLEVKRTIQNGVDPLAYPTIASVYMNVCAESTNPKPCQCSDEQRMLMGMWTTLEINMALNKDYKLVWIYEVYHWPETTQYDPETGDRDLFSEYVNAFLKIKQEASRWPEWCKTEEDKNHYIASREGISLEPDRIQKDPGMRSLAKLCLNRYVFTHLTDEV